MKPVDVIVVGGGMVGLSAALMAARQGLQVALVEAHVPKAWRQDEPDLRVVALALDSQALIESFGLWQEVLARRAHPYSAMTVFDAVHPAPLRFNAGDLGRPHLGHILENEALVEVLWQAVVREPNIQRHCPDKINQLQQLETEVRVGLQSGTELCARLAIGADEEVGRGALGKFQTVTNQGHPFRTGQGEADDILIGIFLHFHTGISVCIFKHGAKRGG